MKKDQTYQILKAGKAEDCSEIDRQKMLALFHQSEKEYEIKEILIEDLFNTTSIITPSPDFKSLFNKLWLIIEENQKKQNSKTKYFYNTLKIAAVLVIGIFVGMYIFSLKRGKSEALYYVTHSPKGSVSEMLLPDSSIIYLNADSRIRYSAESENGNREVYLNGEAWFDVKKNVEKPFIVHTSLYDVNVTGTRFNVKAYESDDEVTTTLEKGIVSIYSVDNHKLNDEVRLNPGEQVVFNKNTKELSVSSVETKWFTSWKDNKLVFVNMNLKDLVVLLERKYGVDIDIINKEILNLHFDGTIKNESIIEFLEIVKNALPINYKIVGQKIEITNKNI